MQLNVIHTDLSVGLEKPIRILHITDLHLLYSDARDCEEIRELSVSRTACFPHSAEVYAELLSYLPELAPDVLVMTGDMADFPSYKNTEALQKLVAAAGCPFLFVPGNHDWSLPKQYQSAYQYQTYMPLFDTLDGGTPEWQVKEYGGLSFFGIDNSRDRVTAEQTEAFRKTVQNGKPCIVFAHVPFYADTLIEDVVRVWKSPIVIGHEKSDAPTKQFCAEVAKRASAVVTGHIHFSHEDMLPDSTCPQLVTALAEEGTVRLLTVF